MKTSRCVVMVALVLCAYSPKAWTQGAATSSPTPAQIALAAQRITAEAVRNKKTRVTGGDFDDKTDRITFTVKLSNPDPKVDLNDLKAEFYVLAQSMVNKKTFQLLGKDESSFSLPARGSHSFTTEEVTTMWDNTGIVFGTKYDGWALVVRDSTGKILLKKATTPFWTAAVEKLGKIPAKSYFNQNLNPTTTPPR